MALVFLFTKRMDLTAAVGSIEMVGKVALFFFHERLWDRIHFGRHEIKPAVLWFTGLSGSGKSTIADRVYARLLEMGCRVERLDGDTLRDVFPQTGFTRAERNDHLQRVGYLTGRLERHGIFVVASFVSPYEESRQFVRGQCKNLIEIYVSTPLEECERRDVKGLYKKARDGQIKNFTGIDDPYEPPCDPELVIDTSHTTIDEATTKVLDYLNRRGVSFARPLGFTRKQKHTHS